LEIHRVAAPSGKWKLVNRSYLPALLAGVGLLCGGIGWAMSKASQEALTLHRLDTLETGIKTLVQLSTDNEVKHNEMWIQITTNTQAIKDMGARIDEQQRVLMDLLQKGGGR